MTSEVESRRPRSKLSTALMAATSFGVAASLLLGCKSANPPARTDSTGHADSQEILLEPALLPYAAATAEIPKSELRTILADPLTDDLVKSLIDDGVISFPDYEAAVLSAMACIRETGGLFRSTDPKLSVRGVYSWVSRIPGSPTNTSAVETAAGCRDSRLGILEFYWKRLVAPAEREIEAAMREMGECMAAGGLADRIPREMGVEQFRQIPSSLPPETRQVYLSCARSTQDRWGLIGFVSESWE